MARRDWNPILAAAAAMVNGYAYLITLRQLHYLLVMSGLPYDNTEQDYKQLSSRTAKARRAGWFPDLLDQTREIVTVASWLTPEAALADLATQWAFPHNHGQQHLIVLGGEKQTLLAQLQDWFSELHLPIVLLRGYGSQTYTDDVMHYVGQHMPKGRTVLIYAGDLDPSGEDILRDFQDRCPVFTDVIHVAIDQAQIATYSLPVNPGKVTDSRAGGFIAKYGTLMQVEVEALPPDDLRDLYQAAIDQWWDVSAYEAALEAEKYGQALLDGIRDAVDDGSLALDGGDDDDPDDFGQLVLA